MPIIPLHNALGEEVAHAIIDQADVEKVSKHQWSLCRGYAHCAYRHSDGTKSTISMHRLVLGLPFGDKRIADHINHDKLDNRRSNLRCTDAVGNGRNRISKTKKCVGVYQIRKGPRRVGKYLAQIKVEGCNKFLGYFTEEHDAINARKAAERLYWHAHDSHMI